MSDSFGKAIPGIMEQTVCGKCGAPLINAPSGAVCSRSMDCGGLLPKLTAKAERRNTAILSLGLPDAAETADGYVIHGEASGVVFRRCDELSKRLAGKRVTRWPATVDKSRYRLAMQGANVIVLHRKGEQVIRRF